MSMSKDKDNRNGEGEGEGKGNTLGILKCEGFNLDMIRHMQTAILTKDMLNEQRAGLQQGISDKELQKRVAEESVELAHSLLSHLVYEAGLNRHPLSVYVALVDFFQVLSVSATNIDDNHMIVALAEKFAFDAKMGRARDQAADFLATLMGSSPKEHRKATTELVRKEAEANQAKHSKHNNPKHDKS